MNMFTNFFKWLSQNKEWFFPTVIPTVISAATSLFIFRKSKHEKLRGIRAITQTTVEFGMVNIKVTKVPGEDDGNGTAIVKLGYLGSAFVDAPQRPVIYKDKVSALPTLGRQFIPKIISQEFKPKANITNPDDFHDYSNKLEYEIVGHKNEPLSFVGKVVITRELQEQQGFIGLHIPHYVKQMIVQIDISEAKFIKNYNGKSQLKNTTNNNATIMQTFNELSMTYTITVINAPKDCDLVFAWENEKQNHNIHAK